MSISVRVATAADSDFIAGLQRSACDEAVRYRGHLDPVLTPTVDAVVLVGGEAVGTVSFADEGDVRNLTFVHVHADARGIGAGDALIGWVLADATQRGIRTVRAAALPGDRSTKNLFERNGLVARAIQVERRLD